MANEIFVNSELLMEHIILSEGCSSCSLRCDSNLAGSKVPRMRNLLHFEIKKGLAEIRSSVSTSL